jgi:hypothetical protein
MARSRGLGDVYKRQELEYVDLGTIAHALVDRR